MQYLMLKGEMAKKDVKIESVSQLLGIHRNSVANKLRGDSSFSVEEAIKIRDKFFPQMEIEELFQKEDIKPRMSDEPKGV